MSQQLKEWLPNPTFVDYQVPHDGQGADFYDEHKMLEYGKRIVKKCAELMYAQDHWESVENGNLIKEHFGME